MGIAALLGTGMGLTTLRGATTASGHPRRGMTLSLNPSPWVHAQGEGFVYAAE